MHCTAWWWLKIWRLIDKIDHTYRSHEIDWCLIVIYSIRPENPEENEWRLKENELDVKRLKWSDVINNGVRKRSATKTSCRVCGANSSKTRVDLVLVLRYYYYYANVYLHFFFIIPFPFLNKKSRLPIWSKYIDIVIHLILTKKKVIHLIQYLYSYINRCCINTGTGIGCQHGYEMTIVCIFFIQ